MQNITVHPAARRRAARRLEILMDRLGGAYKEAVSSLLLAVEAVEAAGDASVRSDALHLLAVLGKVLAEISTVDPCHPPSRQRLAVLAARIEDATEGIAALSSTESDVNAKQSAR